jgi:hypothetical protein
MASFETRSGKTWHVKASSSAVPAALPQRRGLRMLVAALPTHMARMLDGWWARPFAEVLAAIEIIRTGPFLIHYPRRMPAKARVLGRFLT